MAVKRFQTPAHLKPNHRTWAQMSSAMCTPLERARAAIVAAAGGTASKTDAG